ncbi:phage head-tail connector protein [Risungbinella massiliensis]|uniref:phage head-tail connector protein n=1 Tax=Risungbinella massiliensis TaxID=1329796 RepID=UPI0005CC6F30|nr:phage head-tail connector protein [Risungbinella massiliensis]
MTLEEVKTLLHILNDKNDAYLTAIIPMVEDFVKSYCNQQFQNELGETVFPGAVKLVIAQLCRYHMKDGQIQFDMTRNNTITNTEQYPLEMLKTLNLYRKPRFI